MQGLVDYEARKHAKKRPQKGTRLVQMNLAYSFRMASVESGIRA